MPGRPGGYGGGVPSTSLVALLDARPTRPFWARDWLQTVLDTRLPRRDTTPERLLGWSTGSVFGAESLVQSRPILRGPADPIEDILRTPSNVTVAVFSSGPDDDAASPRDVVRTARFRRWVSVGHHRRLDEGERRALVSALPPFLARDAAPKPDGELLLLRFLAALHQQGAFGPAIPQPAEIRDALTTLREVTDDLALDLLLTDGHTLGVIHGSGSMLMFEPETKRPSRPFRVTPDSGTGATVSLVTWMQGEPASSPVGPLGERLRPGIFTLASTRPTQPERS